jgi:hypothetical protein
VRKGKREGGREGQAAKMNRLIHSLLPPQMFFFFNFWAKALKLRTLHGASVLSPL